MIIIGLTLFFFLFWLCHYLFWQSINIFPTVIAFTDINNEWKFLRQTHTCFYLTGTSWSIRYFSSSHDTIKNILDHVDDEPTSAHFWNSRRSIDRGMIDEPSRFESLQIMIEWCLDASVSTRCIGHAASSIKKCTTCWWSSETCTAIRDGSSHDDHISLLQTNAFREASTRLQIFEY